MAREDRSRSPVAPSSRDNGESLKEEVSSRLNIYMCRHGTTFWNLEGRWQGQKDTELAPTGITQAEETANLLAERAGAVQRIYTSDLQRARQTAEIYSKRFHCDVVVEPGLREPSLGRFEGMTKEEIYTEYAALFERLATLAQTDRVREAYFEGLESPLDTSHRAEAVANRVHEEMASSKSCDSVLFVTHSKVLEAVLACVFGKFYEGVETKPCAFFKWSHAKGADLLGETHRIEFHSKIVPQ